MFLDIFLAVNLQLRLTVSLSSLSCQRLGNSEQLSPGSQARLVRWQGEGTESECASGLTNYRQAAPISFPPSKISAPKGPGHTNLMAEEMANFTQNRMETESQRGRERTLGIRF